MAPFLKSLCMNLWQCIFSVWCLPQTSGVMTGMKGVSKDHGALTNGLSGDSPELSGKWSEHPAHPVHVTQPPGDLPGTPLPDPVGVNTIFIGVFGVLGVGVCIAIGLLVCRLCIKTPCSHSPFNRKSTGLKATYTERKRYLDAYNNVRISNGDFTEPGDHHDPDDIPTDHYYSDVMHSRDITITHECSSPECCDMNSSAAPMLYTPMVDTSANNGLISNNTRVE